MEEWRQQQQQGRGRSFSMSYADNVSFYQHQPQQKQHVVAQHQPLAPPQRQSFPPGVDSFLQEGSPSMSSCGSDDAAYSSDTVVTDYTPLHQLPPPPQLNAFGHQAQPVQRRASLSSTPTSAVTGGLGGGASMGILGGFVGEGLRAEYASRRPGGRRKSICLSPSQQELQTDAGDASSHYSVDSEMLEQETEAMRRSSLPAAGFAGQRRNSLSCPLVHNYTPLTAVPTLGRALAEGNLGQRKSIQSFLSMLAQSSHERSEKRRKKKGPRKDRKRYKRSDYDESSDEDCEDDSGEEGSASASGAGQPGMQANFSSPAENESGSTPFSGFDYSSGALATEGGGSSDSSSDSIPTAIGDQSTPGPYEPVAPMSGSEQLFPYSSGGVDASHSGTPPSYGGGVGGARPRSLSSPPYYGDSQAPMTHQQQLQRQYHIAQTNKRLQELRQQHLERLQRQMEQQQQQQQQHQQAQQQQPQQQYTPLHYAQQFHQPPQPQQHQGYPPQAHVIDLGVQRPPAQMAGLVGSPQHIPTASSSLPSALPSDAAGPVYHHRHGNHGHFDPEPLSDQVLYQQQSLSQELMEQQVRGEMADFDFYNEFSDFNMCEPANMESLCRTTALEDVPHHKPHHLVASLPVGAEQIPDGLVGTDDGPVSEILDEFSVVPASAFHNGSWLGSGSAHEASDSLYPAAALERRDQANVDDVFDDFFNLDDHPGTGSSH